MPDVPEVNNEASAWRELFVGTKLEQVDSITLPSGVTITKSAKKFAETQEPLVFTVDLDPRIDGIPKAAITSRDLRSSLEQLPDNLIERLRILQYKNQLHKLIILGNGFSTFPLEIISLLPETCQVVIVDLFSYYRLVEELQPYKFIPQVERIINLIEQLKIAEDSERLQVIQHKVGDINHNQLLTNADAVINVCGPTPSTLVSQIKMLNEKGLLISWFGTFDAQGNNVS